MRLHTTRLHAPDASWLRQRLKFCYNSSIITSNIINNNSINTIANNSIVVDQSKIILLLFYHEVQRSWGFVQAQASSQAELRAVQAELQGATEMLDTMQEMASSSMEGQEEAQKQMDALTAQLQAAIQVASFME